jgi:hypothetical protein
MIRLMLFPFLAVHLAAADAPTRLPLDAEALQTPEICWYGVYMANAKIGYVKEAQLRKSDAPDAPYLAEVAMLMRITALGQKAEIEYGETYEFDPDPPYALRRYSNFERTEDSRKETEIVKAARGFKAVQKSAGRTVTKRLDALDLTLADMATPEIWARTKPAVGEKITARSFSPDLLKIGTETYTVKARKEAIVEGVMERFVELDVASSEVGKVGVFRIDDRGNMLSGTIGNGFAEFRREPENLAKKITYSADLFVFGQATVDKPIGDPSRIEELVLRVQAPAPFELPHGAGQSLVREGGSTMLRLGKGAAPPPRATPEEITDGLAETLTYPSRHPEVLKLCRKAIGDAAAPRDKVKRLVSFVSAYIEDDYGADASSVFDVITRKRGDCTEHALLLTTLARAAGIPARDITGLVYMGDEVKAFGLHAWSEVVLDGAWIPVDPTFDEMEINATHIKLGSGLAWDVALETWGKLRFELVKVVNRS